MRKLLLMLPLLLAACAGGSGLTSEEVNTLVASIRAQAAQACSFAPDVASATALIGQFYQPAEPYIALTNAVVAAICQAPVTKSVRRGGALTQTRVVVTPKGGTVKVTGSPVAK